jgi:hypothetical protein
MGYDFNYKPLVKLHLFLFDNIWLLFFGVKEWEVGKLFLFCYVPEEIFLYFLA